VARGAAYEINPFNTGRLPSAPGTTNFVQNVPLPVTMELLQRGRERYKIYCAVCHNEAGDGKGITGRYGMVGMANFHEPRLVQMPDGEYFDTITHGKNNMGAYAANIEINDRWAIVAYIRALQRSQNAGAADVPAAVRAEIEQVQSANMSGGSQGAAAGGAPAAPAPAAGAPTDTSGN
jgi:mono/diheme cytochrome c family protein